MDNKSYKLEFFSKAFANGINSGGDIEVVIPDSSNDIARILNTYGFATVDSIEQKSKNAKASGRIIGTVIYVPEGSEAPKKIDYTIPYTAELNNSRITDATKIIAIPTLARVDTREANPRKLSIMGEAKVLFSGYEDATIEQASELVDYDKLGLQFKEKQINALLPVYVGDDIFTVTESLDVEDEEIGEVLKVEAAQGIDETKIVGNKAVSKGLTQIKVTYTDAKNTLQTAEFEVPFTQVLTIPEGFDDSEGLVTLTMADRMIDVARGIEGDIKKINVKLVSNVNLRIFSDSQVNVIEDVYSTKYDIDTMKCDKNLLTGRKASVERVNIIENVPVTNDLHKIIDVSVLPLGLSVSDDKISLEMVSDVMYEDGSSRVFNKEIRSVASLPIVGETDISEVNYKISSAYASVDLGNSIALKVAVDFSTVSEGYEDFNMVCDINVEDLSEKDRTKDASVSLVFVRDKMDIWQLAKRYNTTVENIKIANNLESDDISKTKVLLIPKCN